MSIKEWMERPYARASRQYCDLNRTHYVLVKVNLPVSETSPPVDVLLKIPFSTNPIWTVGDLNLKLLTLLNSTKEAEDVSVFRDNR